MDLQASRLDAREDDAGEPVLLLAQDRIRWNSALIRAGFVSLDDARRHSAASGFYTLQAAIAACHARATRPEAIDWTAIVQLYTALFALDPSPVVALSRAVAVGMADGPAAAPAARGRAGR